METAKLLRYEAVASIRGELEDSTNWESFLAAAQTIANDTSSQLLLPFDVGQLPPLTTSADRAVYETTNAISLYTSLGAMPKVAASDPRLWSYLTFGPYSGYMRARWPLNDGRSWKKRVSDRWMVKSNTTGALRLWWLADLTFDPKLERKFSSAHQDEWAYTKAALANEDRVMAIFDRGSGAIGELRFALLDRCLELGDEASEDWLRRLMKEITLANGYSDLSFRSYDDLYELIRETEDAS